jgi:hypothetical protein
MISNEDMFKDIETKALAVNKKAAALAKRKEVRLKKKEEKQRSIENARAKRQLDCSRQKPVRPAKRGKRVPPEQYDSDSSSLSDNHYSLAGSEDSLFNSDNPEPLPDLQDDELNEEPEPAMESDTETKTKTPTDKTLTVLENRLLMPDITYACVANGKYYTCYYTKPKLTYYWGSITKTFSNDDDTNNTQSEVDFLKNISTSKTPKDWFWTKTKETSKDISILNNHFLFFGPVTPKWQIGVAYFPEDVVWQQLQQHIATLNSQENMRS